MEKFEMKWCRRISRTGRIIKKNIKSGKKEVEYLSVVIPKDIALNLSLKSGDLIVWKVDKENGGFNITFEKRGSNGTR